MLWISPPPPPPIPPRLFYIVLQLDHLGHYVPLYFFVIELVTQADYGSMLVQKLKEGDGIVLCCDDNCLATIP